MPRGGAAQAAEHLRGRPADFDPGEHALLLVRHRRQARCGTGSGGRRGSATESDKGRTVQKIDAEPPICALCNFADGHHPRVDK